MGAAAELQRLTTIFVLFVQVDATLNVGTNWVEIIRRAAEEKSKWIEFSLHRENLNLQNRNMKHASH